MEKQNRLCESKNYLKSKYVKSIADTSVIAWDEIIFVSDIAAIK